MLKKTKTSINISLVILFSVIVAALVGYNVAVFFYPNSVNTTSMILAGISGTFGGLLTENLGKIYRWFLVSFYY